jgi:hypothetical protein
LGVVSGLAVVGFIVCALLYYRRAKRPPAGLDTQSNITPYHPNNVKQQSPQADMVYSPTSHPPHTANLYGNQALDALPQQNTASPSSAQSLLPTFVADSDNLSPSSISTEGTYPSFSGTQLRGPESPR